MSSLQEADRDSSILYSGWKKVECSGARSYRAISYVLRSAPPPGPQLLTRRRSPTREAHQQFIENFRVLAQNLEDQVREIRKRFDERIQQVIVKVTSDEIAEALTKRVLTVRTAARGENVDVVIRQASSAEIRAGKLF
jgi:hypothetical protein